MNLDSGSELSVNQRACPVPRREAEDPVYAHHSQPPEDPVYAYHWPPPETHDVKEKPRSGDFHLLLRYVEIPNLQYKRRKQRSNEAYLHLKIIA